MKKALFILTALFAFAVVLSVGSSDASAIKKAPKTELVVLKNNDVYSPVVNLNVDAEFSPIVFEVATASVIEHPYTIAQYSLLMNIKDVSRGPPKFGLG